MLWSENQRKSLKTEGRSPEYSPTSFIMLIILQQTSGFILNSAQPRQLLSAITAQPQIIAH